MPKPDPVALRRRKNAIQVLSFVLAMAVLLLAYSAAFALKETRYTAKGRTAVANVTKAEPAPEAGTSAMRITYQFTDAEGVSHTETRVFPHNGVALAIQRHFDVAYVSGAAGSSMPAFDRRTWALPVTLTAFFLALVAGIFLARIVKQEVRMLPEKSARKRESFRVQRRTA